MGSWFNNCMPRIKDVKPTLSQIVHPIQEMEGIKSMYVWGSFVKNLKNPNFRLRDIDILARTRFHSGDLLAIDENIIKQAMSDEELENQGFDPQCVKFSRKFVELSKYNIDHWSLSSDRKLLHWGPIMVNEKESDEVNKEAERYAQRETGLTRKAINKSAESTRKNWYNSYCRYLSKYFENMPSGWYKTEDIKVKEIIAHCLEF